jgi:glycosyltransferase involved in cell wall biosynthesis
VKVLVVLTQPPAAEGGAPGRCALGLLRGLIAHGVEVRALAARQHFAMPGDVPADLLVEVVDVPPEPPGWRARWQRLRRPRGELARGEFGRRVREAAGAADIVHLEETETAWCDQGVATPSLVHVHYLVRRDRKLGPPWQREGRHVLELEFAERAAVRRHRRLVASSPLVADALRVRAPDADVVLAPLSLDASLYTPAYLDDPPVAGLIGTGAWPPTRSAVERLLKSVWPRVRRLAPDSRLLVAGRSMGFLKGRDLGAGVEFLGEVESSREFLRGLSALLFPLERGSGMKVKTLEAMASGVPVVTTPTGAEGIEPNEGVVVAEADEDFAVSAAGLLTDAGERRQRGAAARSTFERRYSPEPATEPLLELYARMAQPR